ncbi:hypothetical protein HYFRA_00010268 [Hymenoscyphus fraxineus]|uniref:MFS general substrate transporter n=1 Tax=Hymenoscyphus fraxineus TaxID=746836 RepID=A0A9N9KXP4_9HELO|nr:hypothetical protein HYFRA_00010268 [Hymenoscyphus fraxineus]
MDPKPPLPSEKHLPNTSTSDISTNQISPLHSSPSLDRALTTRIDFKVIPILGLLYLICFLDRTNIANAKLAGLEAGLHMPSNGYNTALWIFYIPFVLAEVPSNIVMSASWVRPNLWLGGQCLVLDLKRRTEMRNEGFELMCIGILAMCQGLTHSYQGLLAVRFLMGIVETGLPAGAGLLIASYYRKKELSLRFALFLAFGESGSCFSGLLAYALQGMDGVGGYAGWRWIFIVEGLVTIVFSILVFIFTPNFPARDTWLKSEDKNRLLARLEADKGEEKTATKKVPWIRMMFDARIWSMYAPPPSILDYIKRAQKLTPKRTLLFFCADMSAGSLSAFNPTILSQVGWTSRRAQVMTIPVWIIGIVGGLLTSLLSGRTNKRWPFILPAILISLLGWIIHYLHLSPPSIRYFAQFLISFGTFVQMPLYIGLLTANLRGRAYQSLGTALQLGIGNCANFVSSNVFIKEQAPRYPVGFGVGLGITVLAFPVMMGVVWGAWVHNRKLQMRLDRGEVFDDQVDFMYVY